MRDSDSAISLQHIKHSGTKIDNKSRLFKGIQVMLNASILVYCFYGYFFCMLLHLMQMHKPNSDLISLNVCRNAAYCSMRTFFALMTANAIILQPQYISIIAV